MVNKFTNKLVLKKSKNGSQQTTEEKNNSVQTSSSSSIMSIRAKLVCLLKTQPDGIPLDKLVQRFEQKYSKTLCPNQYKCKSLSELLANFIDVIDLRYCSSMEKPRVILKEFCLDKCDNDDFHPNIRQERLNAAVFSEIQAKKEETMNHPPQKFIKVLKAILESYGGSCIIENIPYEYEHRTNHKLNIQEMGYSTILHLLTNLGDEFGIQVLDNGQSILKLRGDPILEDKLTAIALHESMNNGKKKFSKQTSDRVKKLLTEYYPDGLTEGEINGTYKGIIGNELNIKGSKMPELNPPTYDTETISEMFQGETDTVKVVYRKNILYYVTPNTHETMSEQVFGDLQEKQMRSQRDDGLPFDVVKKHEKFTLLKLNELLKPTSCYDVVGGDCYSAKRFYIQLRSSQHANALDILVENMACFYTSDIRKRYVVPDDCLLVRYPLCFFYPQHDCYYRGAIISWEDMESMKVFLVDYGTEYITTKENAFLLHREFFKLPVQGIKTQLYGIEPPDGRENFMTCYSKPFLDMIVDKVFSIYIHKIEDNTLFVTAYNVPQDETEEGGLDDTKRTEHNTRNINKELVALNCARFDAQTQYPTEKIKLDRIEQQNMPRTVEGVTVLTNVAETEEPVKVQVPTNVSAKTTENTTVTNVKGDSDDAELSGRMDITLNNGCHSDVDKHYCSSLSQASLRELSKIGSEHQARSASPESQFSLLTRTPSFSDMSTYLKTSESTSRNDRHNMSQKLSTSSSLYYSPQHSHHSGYVNGIPNPYSIGHHLSSAALEFIPRLDTSHPQMSPMIRSMHHSPRTANRANYLEPSVRSDLMGHSSVQLQDMIQSDEEEIETLSSSATENCHIDVRCEVRQISISEESKIRTIKHNNELYMAVDEFNYLILDAEQLQTVLEVCASSNTYTTEITFTKNPDIFMMLCRYGADYLFTKDNKIVTKIQLIDFSVVLPIIQQVYPKNEELLDRIKAAEEDICTSSTSSSPKKTESAGEQSVVLPFHLSEKTESNLNTSRVSSIQPAKTENAREQFKLRDIYADEIPPRTPETVAIGVGGIPIQNGTPTVGLRARDTEWETQSAICGHNATSSVKKAGRSGMRKSFSQNHFPVNMSAVPNMPQPPGFNQYYAPHFQNAHMQNPHIGPGNLFVNPNYINPALGLMPYNGMYQLPQYPPGVPYPPGYF